MYVFPVLLSRFYKIGIILYEMLYQIIVTAVYRSIVCFN